jgi:hypothetical protein
MRTTFVPNDQERAARHMVGLQQDVGPWFRDYVDEIAKPAVDLPTVPYDPTKLNGNGGPLQ